jgi:hypothetical protein
MCKFVKRVTVSTPTAEVSPLAERRETVMNPCDFLLLVFCLVDDELQALHLGRLRTRGPQPTLSDSEVLTMEIVGEFWGLDQDKKIFEHFRRYHCAEFPALANVCRTTWVRQAANLWNIKEAIRLRLLDQLPGDPKIGIVDSQGLPICLYARANRCQQFSGEAAFGFDHISKQYFYGFRLHLRIRLNGIIERFELAGANVSELAIVPELMTEGTHTMLGDRNYWSPELQAELQARGCVLLSPFKHRSRDKDPKRSKALNKPRRRVETTIGQLTERFHCKRTWARDLWHLRNRLIRKILSHTVAVLLNVRMGNPPLQLEHLLAA